MRLFDEHVILRFALLFASFIFATIIADIVELSDNIYNFIPFFLAIIFLAYVSLFYKFPNIGNIRKIRNDVNIPEKVNNESVRDLQKDLLEKGEVLQMMIDASLDGFWTFDVPSGKVYWSSKVADLLGVPANQVEDTFVTLKNRILEGDWSKFKEKLAKSLEENEKFTMELRLTGKTKFNKKKIRISGSPQNNEEGRPIRVVGTISTTLDQQSIEKQNYYYVYQDALTGVYNRKFFLEKLKVDVDMAARKSDYSFAVALLDIDSFGAINDSYSTKFGDNVLRIVSDRIKSSIRENDCIARIGPDVFAVIMHDINGLQTNEDLMPVVKRMHSKVKTPIQLDGRELYISVSMAVVLNNDADCVEDLLASANAVLRDLKKSTNHGGIQFLKGDIREKAMKLFKLEYDIRRAIQAQEFVLMYQPIIDINAGNRIVGFEALVRWNSSEQGMLPPATFIPLAEETGLIVPMGAQILKMACIQAKKWVDLGFKDIRIAVNFSAKQFSLDNMVDDVKQVLLETHLSPKNLKLEITEYTAMCEVEKTVGIMRALSDMGLQISIDDFGTGYSSLSYLKRYPIHTLKMDKSFVDHITEEEEDRAFAKMVIGLATTLNLELIAEGVEYEDQLEFLRQEGCHLIQGYYFSPPLPPEKALEYMQNHYTPQEPILIKENAQIS